MEKKKVIRLTESDIENLVKKIIKEDGISDAGYPKHFGDLQYGAEDIYNELVEKLGAFLMDEMTDISFDFNLPDESDEVARQLVDAIYTQLTMDEIFGNGMMDFSEEDFKHNKEELISIFSEMIEEMHKF